MALSIDDLRHIFYGGGTDAEMAFLRSAQSQGISAQDLLSIAAAGGGMLAGSAVVTNFSAVAISNAGPTDAAGLTFSYTANGTSGLILAAYMPSQSVTGGSGKVRCSIYEGATLLELADSNIVAATSTVNSLLNIVPLIGATKPSAGEHTYKVQMQTITATAGTYTSGATFPAWFLGLLVG